MEVLVNRVSSPRELSLMCFLGCRRHAMNQVAELCKFTFPNSTSPSTGYISFKFRVVNRSSSRNEFSISSTRVETAGASYQGRSKVSRACRNYLVSFRFQYKQALGLTVWPHREWQPVRYTSHRRLNGQVCYKEPAFVSVSARRVLLLFSWFMFKELKGEICWPREIMVVAASSSLLRWWISIVTKRSIGLAPALQECRRWWLHREPSCK